ncbi:CLM1 protein, partial [Dicaeum eximium]|nr:CLM1 protein [Dicaeum eximium]
LLLLVLCCPTPLTGAMPGWVYSTSLCPLQVAKQGTVEQGSSLAVSCSYKPNSKYWCHKNSLSFCLTYIVQTDGSEVTVTWDRASIRDNHTANSFTVTLSSVTAGDA